MKNLKNNFKLPTSDPLQTFPLSIEKSSFVEFFWLPNDGGGSEFYHECVWRGFFTLIIKLEKMSVKSSDAGCEF